MFSLLVNKHHYSFRFQNTFMSTFPEITTPELENQRSNSGVSIIDCRPVDAYNGWCMKSEERGGHIPGARSLPYKWAGYIDWIEIVRSKKIWPQQKIILYGYNNNKTEQIAEMFRRTSYEDVVLYPGFLDEWVPDKNLPLEKLSRYKNLISPQWLNALIETGEAGEYNNNKYVICHAHYQNRADYKKGHIPGAIDIDTNSLESLETWNRRNPEELKKTLLEAGISSDTTVIVYGRFAHPRNDDPYPGSSAGHLGAIRCAAIMLYAGVKDVRVLNGGLQSWLDAGYPTTSRETSREPAEKFGAQIPGRPELFIDTPEAKNVLATPNQNLVSIRSWPEYTGKVSGYNYIEKTGHIPGSVFGNCGTDAYHMENYRNLDHTIREYQETKKIWEEVGITPDKKNVFYCGTGWRGSEAFFNAWLMGWPDVAIYDGGWFEWSSDPENPVGMGVPED